MIVNSINNCTSTYSGVSSNAKIYDTYGEKSVNAAKRDEYYKNYSNVEIMNEYYTAVKQEMKYNAKMDGQCTEIMHSFYEGEISKEDVKQKVKDLCTENLEYRIKEGYTDGNDVQYNKKILARIYERAQYGNVSEAIALCLDEGKQIADKYGGYMEYNWMYYNSDYYYMEKDICGSIKEAIDEMSEEWGSSQIDFEEVEEKSGLEGMEFNQLWQQYAWKRRIICMTDLTAEPPEDFTFFYQERKSRTFDKEHLLESQKGCLEITYKNQKWQADIPYDRYSDNLIEFYHMEDFISKYLLGDMDSECRNFLSKFDIFTEVWASTRGDSMWLYKHSR